MRVLLSAYACRPDRGSEPGVGWNVALEMAKHHEVWVLTQDDDRRTAIGNAPEAELNQNLHFVYYTLPKWPDRWRQGIRGQGHYYLWQIGAYFRGRKLHEEVNFDLVHHITYVKYWSPSFLSLLDVPFLWGPVGGGESAPRDFWRSFGFRGRAYEHFRRLAQRCGELDPFTRLTARRSRLTLSTTRETAERVQSLGAKNISLLSETGLSDNELQKLGSHRILAHKSRRFISMGRLLHWKGTYLGLRAFAEARIRDSEFWIVGAGPEQQRLKDLTRELRIEDQVRFWGNLPREEALMRLGESGVLVHPSLHDSGGWVCIEAMATGKPVICLDLGGPATQVTDRTGIKVAAQSEDQAVADLARAMKLLSEDNELRVSLGESARERVLREYSWSKKGEQLSTIYDKLTQERKNFIKQQRSTIIRKIKESKTVQSFVQRLGRGVVLKRHMPRQYGGDSIFISPESAVRLWHPNLERFDKSLFRWASEFVDEGDVVWDVGANVGLFTFAAASLAGTSGHIVAIEADTWLVNLLRKSVRYKSRQRAPVDVIPIAVSQSVDIAKLNVAVRGRVRNYLEGAGGSKTTGGVREAHSVATFTLDWLLERFPVPSVLKIDVEGAEYQILKAGQRVLSEVRPIILCEVRSENAEAVSNLLHSHRYELFDLDIERYNRQPVGSTPFNTLAYPISETSTNRPQYTFDERE